MSLDTEPMAAAPAAGPDEESAADAVGESAPLLFGSGQSAWLALLTLGVGVALALSIVALMMANDEDAGTTATPSGPATELEVSMSEFAFDPDTATVAPGAEITIVNDGSIEHNWTIFDTPVTSAADLESAEPVFTLAAAAGESDAGTLDLEPGDYQMICTIAGHLEAGMTGELTVG